MNEIQLIRAQLAVERAHAAAVTNSCANTLGRAEPVALASGSPLELFRQACVDYLVCVLAWFEERDRRLAGLVNNYPAEHPNRDALDEALAGPGRSRDALEKLEAAFAHTAGAGGADARQVWQAFARQFHGPWSARREALDALLAANTRPADWRAYGGIDADSILEERARYQRVTQTLPAGVTLAVTAARSL